MWQLGYRACSVYFTLMRETAGMRLRRFPAKELHESQPAGPITKTKQVRKVRQRYYWRYGCYIKRLVRNGGVIMDFIGVRKTLFNH